jgi:pimeloyl-ACP methyl ester carboxylesterase
MLFNGCDSIGNLIADYTDPWHERVRKAGIVEKQTEVNQVLFNYAEGPNNGPELLLLNAQHMDWYSYSRVLPKLSEKFHVFAVDYQGHGKTNYPDDYPLNANRIGNDLAAFIETVIQQQVYVTGNSSGGLLTAWLAANRPDLVKAIVLEDPPLFSSEYPEIQQTISYRSFTTCHNFIEQDEEDFLLFWLNSNSQFVAKNVGENALPIIVSAIRIYRDQNPGEALEIFFLPEMVRLMLRGMEYYDSRFGAAFYDGSWNEGFDHAENLRKIKCPALLIHANFNILEDGVLYGAMDQDEADRVVTLIPDVEYVRVDAEHVVHLDKPAKFIQILEGFFL